MSSPCSVIRRRVRAAAWSFDRGTRFGPGPKCARRGCGRSLRDRSKWRMFTSVRKQEGSGDALRRTCGPGGRWIMVNRTRWRAEGPARGGLGQGSGADSASPRSQATNGSGARGSPSTPSTSEGGRRQSAAISAPRCSTTATRASTSGAQDNDRAAIPRLAIAVDDVVALAKRSLQVVEERWIEPERGLVRARDLDRSPRMTRACELPRRR